MLGCKESKKTHQFELLFFHDLFARFINWLAMSFLMPSILENSAV
jgi:hypothetical protein